jgi:antitoxin (DNA-binding transcriptional repressor) of toxin-antitoxin stability system
MAMITRVRIAELKDHLSAHLRAVEAGETIEVLDRERPIARIVPLDSSGSVTLIPAQRPFAEIRDRVYPSIGLPVSSLELLLEERGDR